MIIHFCPDYEHHSLWVDSNILDHSLPLVLDHRIYSFPWPQNALPYCNCVLLSGCRAGANVAHAALPHTTSAMAVCAQPPLCGASHHWVQPRLLILGSKHSLKSTAVGLVMYCHWLLSRDQVFDFPCRKQELLDRLHADTHLGEPSQLLLDGSLSFTVPMLNSENVSKWLLATFPPEMMCVVCFITCGHFYCLL